MDEFETAVVNEPSVFEPLKFYCILKIRGDTLYSLSGISPTAVMRRKILCKEGMHKRTRDPSGPESLT